MSTLAEELDELACSLEKAVSLATTRYEHMRVASHATRARALAVRAIQEDRQTNPPPGRENPSKRHTDSSWQPPNPVSQHPPPDTGGLPNSPGRLSAGPVSCPPSEDPSFGYPCSLYTPVSGLSRCTSRPPASWLATGLLRNRPVSRVPLTECLLT
jgi:hypothetical protein